MFVVTCFGGIAVVKVAVFFGGCCGRCSRVIFSVKVKCRGFEYLGCRFLWKSRGKLRSCSYLYVYVS